MWILWCICTKWNVDLTVPQTFMIAIVTHATMVEPVLMAYPSTHANVQVDALGHSVRQVR